MDGHLEDLAAAVRGSVSDPARQAVAAQLAVDVAQLQARRLAGEDVAVEIAHVRAQAASLSATEAAIVSMAVMDWVGQVAGAGRFFCRPMPW